MSSIGNVGQFDPGRFEVPDAEVDAAATGAAEQVAPTAPVETEAVAAEGTDDLAPADRAEQSLAATMIEQRVREPELLLAESAVSLDALGAGLAQLDEHELAGVEAELAALENALASQASAGPATVSASAPQAAAVVPSAPVPVQIEVPKAEFAPRAPARAESTREVREKGEDSSGSVVSATASGGGAAAAGGGGGVGAAAGPGRSGGGAVRSLDEQGRASIAYTNNIAEPVGLGAGMATTPVDRIAERVSDPTLSFTERIEAARKVLEHGISVLEDELAGA
jgi:hypothetical protein